MTRFQLRRVSIYSLASASALLVLTLVWGYLLGDWNAYSRTQLIPEKSFKSSWWSPNDKPALVQYHRTCTWESGTPDFAKRKNLETLDYDFRVTVTPECKRLASGKPMVIDRAFRNAILNYFHNECSWYDAECHKRVEDPNNLNALYRRYFYGDTGMSSLYVKDECFIEESQICLISEHNYAFHWQWLRDELHEKVLLGLLSISALLLLSTFIPAQILAKTFGRLFKWIREG
jgi:hypothetical protein